jgi:NAD(P)-dependent dehydrogenase (short-subunit alcohol dehydrogenase family)
MGASSGIGRESALRFARKGGSRVMVSARGEEGLDSLVQEIREEGGESLPRHLC